MLLTIGNAYAQEKTRILFILDASNSMNSKWEGNQTRLQAAKELLIKTIDSIKGIPNLEIALRVYGHQSYITPTFQDCNDTKLEVPFASGNFDKVKMRVRSIEAKGTTPIARSLEAAASDFPDMTAKNFIILITDGLEACDNDPCVIAKKLKDKGVRVTPFVIGLGLDLSYLEQFNCIGTYLEAENKAALANVLTTLVQKSIFNTTVQVNLNNITKSPLETDVTMHFYEAGTKNLKYTFVHTLNIKNNPDTLVLDPSLKYDLYVHTLPGIEKLNIVLTRGVHNTIILDAPQGYLQVNWLNPIRNYTADIRIMQPSNNKTFNVQQVSEKDKYIVGTYEIEIMTLPRIYKTVTITQSTITSIDIFSPGVFSFKTGKAVVGQVFLVKDNGELEWVFNLDESAKAQSKLLQPGNYKVVYRTKESKSTNYSTIKDFRIISNKTSALTL